ncbi:amidase [Paenibacillus sp. GP183]|uniref:amidase n=1 Tax=Paenibacillus sp. GP183 TaxID=1882751 RepID=UPI0008973921|nr:amidase [Paenibacillus sp. GP183]SEC16184.1 aspartyl-tRNA(Asn)/glutamyl-tRNA(Gln) amidotransferase subunit A [Paenibacillus sp. GP183]
MIVGEGEVVLTPEGDILNWSLSTLSNAIRKKMISPVEVTNRLLKRIEAINPIINCYVTVLVEEAKELALEAEKEIAAGSWKGPLHGVPIGIKDLIYTKDIKTTMGSAIFKDFVPDHDASVVERLKQAGAIIIGKQNTHQFAYGPTGDRSFFGPVRNPHNTSKMTGGSSSGSAAAVASALCYGAIGSDTGGSIRIPSAACGVVGMKPTFGRVSKFGVYPLSQTLDHIGPITRTVQDNAILLNLLSGYDSRDPYSVKSDAEDFTKLLEHGIKGSVIGVPKSFYFEKLETEIEAQIHQALEIFKSLGAEIRPIDIPGLDEISMAHQTIIRSETYALHENMLRDCPEQYEEEVRERLLLGLEPKAYEYVKALQIREIAKHVFHKALTEVEVILTPTIAILPPDLQQREININGQREQVRSALTRFTGLTNLNGFPSISIPCGLSASSLPIGFQLIGKPFDEANVYRFANAYEQESGLPALTKLTI